MAQNKPDDNQPPLNNYVKYTGMGFQMIVIIGLFTWGGYKIDQWANHGVRWVTAIMSLAGVAISIYLVITSLKNKD
ncbi:MAG: AtpZ/AtpI family protein [Bacteroidetes bacterium]|nr:AtpZ/AtpI family protein [Bacteroidota bacterium]